MLRHIHFRGIVLIGLAGTVSPANAHCPKQGCPPPQQQNSAPQRPIPATQSVHPPSQQQHLPQQYFPQQNRVYQVPNQQLENPRRSLFQPNWRQPSHTLPSGSATDGAMQPNSVRQPSWRGPSETTRVPFIPRAVHVDRQTTAMGRADGRGLTVEHKNADGSRTFAEWRVAPDGRREVEAYRLQSNRRTGTETKVYMDGHRVVTGKNFQTTSAPGRLTVTTYADGRRLAALPDGHPVYKESPGSAHDTVVRTIYERVRRGRAYLLRTPVQETYRIYVSGGASLYEYVPPPAAAGYYDSFMTPLSEEVAFDTICPECANSDAEISRGWFASDREGDPAQIVADMEISRNMDGQPDQADEDIGPDEASDDAGPPSELDTSPADPEVSDLEEQVSQLQQKLQTAEADNASLKSQLGDEEAQNAEMKDRLATVPPSTPKRAKVVVPHDVEKQITKQVQVEIGHLKDQQPLALPDLVASAEAVDFIFTVSKRMSVRQIGAAPTCILSKGDMAKFAQIPAESDAVVQMKIVVSKPGSCEKGAIVGVAKADAQEMLNSFSKDVRASIDQVHDQIAARATKATHG
jgi:hypothetical protein